MDITPKQRMVNAYRGLPSDWVPVAPEFWYYYPAKLLGVDMIQFEKEVPFHLALKTTFERFGCEGWGVAGVGIPNPSVEWKSQEKWLDAGTLEVRTTIKTPVGELAAARRLSRSEPSWNLESPVKDLARDLPAWELAALGGDPDRPDTRGLVNAWNEVGDAYLLEAWLCVPFFDFYGSGRNGGFNAAIYDFLDPDLRTHLEGLRERYTDHVVRKARAICTQTPVESLCIGCTWSNNSLLGPKLWRQWDKPLIKAIADEAHRHGRLVHLHFHGRCMETVADFAELGLDCVCPFERPPAATWRASPASARSPDSSKAAQP
ncbi:MAG: hypothetical protein FJ291_16920 [Planctomycetes bacterium]|nr:hypothetical protein [Planctomycetota bacterium]